MWTTASFSSKWVLEDLLFKVSIEKQQERRRWMTICVSLVLVPRNSPILSLSPTVLRKFKICHPGPEERSFYHSHRNAFHVLLWNSAVHRTSNFYHSLYFVDGWIRDNATLNPFKTISIYLTDQKFVLCSVYRPCNNCCANAVFHIY